MLVEMSVMAAKPAMLGCFTSADVVSDVMAMTVMKLEGTYASAAALRAVAVGVGAGVAATHFDCCDEA